MKGAKYSRRGTRKRELTPVSNTNYHHDTRGYAEEYRVEIPTSSERVVFNAAGLIPLALPADRSSSRSESTKRRERDSDDDGSLAIIAVVSG